MAKVTGLDEDYTRFDDGSHLSALHDTDCCEVHYLEFGGLTLADFKGLNFDLTADTFFERVPGYGIRLIPTNGHPVSIPGYGYNNGYYSDNLTLVLEDALCRREFDITSCQLAC